MTTIFATSKLYDAFINTDNNKNEVENLFLNKIKEFGFTEDQVKDFLNDYKKIQYDENNISQYVNLVLYFQYDIMDRFINYVIYNYVFNKMLFLDKLVNFNTIVEIIKKEFESYSCYSDSHLLYISKYITIENIKFNSIITDHGIKNLTNIHTLNLYGNNERYHIYGYENYVESRNGIKNNTCTLYLNHNNKITCRGIKNFTNIHTLNFEFDNNYNDICHYKLTRNYEITDDGIKNLTNIHTLGLNSYNVITDEGIKNLTNIHTLNLKNNYIITNEGIKNLTNIHTLNLSGNNIITDDGIKNLTNIHTLDLTHNFTISDNGTKHLTNCKIIRWKFLSFPQVSRDFIS